MDKNFTDRIKQTRDTQAEKKQAQARHDEVVGAVKGTVQTDVAKSEDISQVVDSIHKLNMTTFMATKDNWQGVVDQLATLSGRMQSVIDSLDDNAAKKIEKGFSDTVKRLESVAQTMKNTQVESDPELLSAIHDLQTSLNGLEVSPVVNVPAPKVTVSEREVDFSPLVNVMEGLQAGLKGLRESQPTFDTSDLSQGLSDVEQAVRDLIARPIPVPETPLPFKNTDNQGVQSHAVASTTDSTKVGLVVLNPDGSNISGGGGGAGTEYTEDAASVANPVAPALSLRRRDTLASEVTTDGDWVTGNATAKGELYVKHVDSVPVTSATLATQATLNNVYTDTSTIVSSVGVMDDWDESDRAKVNLIVGQAGVAGGSGTVGATTQRVVLATDVALPAGNNNIGDVDVASMPAITGTVTATPEKASSATLANVATSTTSATLLASNSSRKKAVIVNDSAVNMYVKYGATASATSFSYLLQPYDTLEESNYTGIIDGILASSTGTARTTEI